MKLGYKVTHLRKKVAETSDKFWKPALLIETRFNGQNTFVFSFRFHIKTRLLVSGRSPECTTAFQGLWSSDNIKKLNEIK